jgi:hypothetical protein
LARGFLVEHCGRERGGVAALRFAASVDLGHWPGS